jgi:hypothetical protein
MVFAKDGKVTGVVEQEDQGPPRRRVTLGDISGHWVSQVLVRCPGLVSVQCRAVNCSQLGQGAYTSRTCIVHVHCNLAITVNDRPHRLATLSAVRAAFRVSRCFWCVYITKQRAVADISMSHLAFPQGKEGVLYDASSITPAAVPLVSLQQVGPRQLPRLWSAIHDALLYADPRLAVGGKVGQDGP